MLMLTSEQWRISNVVNMYEVSNFGNVRRLHNSRIIKKSINRTGYYMVCLCQNSKKYTKEVAPLIAKEFIDNPDNKPEINHINGNKLDNSVNNLEWVTSSENKKHAYDTKLKIVKKGADSKISIKIIDNFGNIYNGMTTAERLLNLSRGVISNSILRNGALKNGLKFTKLESFI